ncbi:hypothetical protein B0H11DRAFT_2005503, partial [Mycena galericulata]
MKKKSSRSLPLPLVSLSLLSSDVRAPLVLLYLHSGSPSSTNPTNPTHAAYFIPVRVPFATSHSPSYPPLRSRSESRTRT